MEEAKLKMPTKDEFMMEIRRQRVRKHQWQMDMKDYLAGVEVRLKHDREYLYHDMPEMI